MLRVAAADGFAMRWGAGATWEEMKPKWEIKADAPIDWLNKQREERVQFVQATIC